MAQASIALIYGTDTNNTEEVGNKIAKQWEELGEQVDIFNIKDIEVSQLQEYATLILGIPTWDFGCIQSDWEDIEDQLTELSLENTTVALYGLGDQFGYGDYLLMRWVGCMKSYYQPKPLSLANGQPKVTNLKRHELVLKIRKVSLVSPLTKTNNLNSLTNALSSGLSSFTLKELWRPHNNQLTGH